MKIHDQPGTLKRVGDKNKAEEGRHMRTRFVQKLESKMEITPPPKKTRDKPLSKPGTLLKTRNSHDLLIDAAAAVSTRR